MSYEEILIGWRKCEVCNKDIIVTNRRIGIKYCSKRCRNIGNWRVSVLHFPEHSTQYYQKNKERILKRMKKYIHMFKNLSVISVWKKERWIFRNYHSQSTI